MSSRASSSRTRIGDTVRHVTSAVHSGRPCSPCILCKQGNLSKYVHPKSWKNPQLLDLLRSYEPNLNIEPESCICRLCRDDINRISDENFTPRWKKSSIRELCLMPNCNKTSSKVTQLVDLGTLCEIMEISGSDLEDRERQGFPLCHEHYGTLYRKLNPFKRNCKTCNKALLDITKARKCPSPSIVNEFLSKNLDFDGTISEDDRVCTTCYKSHLIIIKHVTHSVQSTDSDLSHKILELKSEISTSLSIQNPEQLLSYTLTLIAVHVAEALLDQGAMLLPDIYDKFTNKLEELAKLYKVQLDQSHTISKTMLRNHLSATLEHHMAYRCYAKKYGTILFRYGGDLTFTLNKFLSKSRQEKNFQHTLNEVCKKLNSKMHDMANAFVREESIQPHKIEDINIDEWIGRFDPDVWRALQILTQPHSASSSEVRLIRCFFCMCVLLFTTNSECSFPMHTFITDAIVTCGGSGRLIKLLNRLGACACVDTLNRYIQYRVDERKKVGIMDGYPDDCLSVASMDNVDFLLKFARVYFSGKLQLSWHGTTVQIVLPKPTNIKDNQPTSKRPLSSRSPSSKVVDETRSPVTKKMRRSRTGMEKARKNLISQLQTVHPDLNPIPSTTETQPYQESLRIGSFHLSSDEQKALDGLIGDTLDYIMIKKASEKPVISLPSYYGLLKNLPAPECSSIIYYGVMGQKCDSKETVLDVINQLHREFISTRKKNWVLLEGDQLTYSLIVSLKEDYGNDLKWLIPIPGDWHVLKNFQEVLHKVFFDGGLSDLAKSCGYLPNSVATNFDRMHKFIVETWESLYWHLMSLFISINPAFSALFDEISSWLKSFPTSSNQNSASRNLKQLLDDMCDKNPNFHTDFISFVDEMAEKDKTWKLWKQYVLEDGFAYISLHLAIRTSNWDLRMSALKKMVAMFTAFDRPNYQKLVTNHIVDIVHMPPNVLTQLKQGGWTVSITGRPCHSVGIDECHEMCINKDCKKYVTRPTPDSIERKAIFMPIRATAMKGIEAQLYHEQCTDRSNEILSLHSKDASDKKFNINIDTMATKLLTSTLQLNQEGAGHLHKLFGQHKISLEQEHDLLNFRYIGQTEFEHSVQYRVLRNPSVKPPKRKKKLLTFTERKTTKKKVSDVEKERKLQIECWKKRIAYCTATGQTLNKLYEQCIELPRAISTSEGEPNKGTKAISTTVYQKRYENAVPPPFLTGFPARWRPSAVIMEGMFLINIVPWDAHKHMSDYACFLIKQHIMPHFRNGANEVHVLFDNPQQNSLKHFERLKRDRANPLSQSHTCTDFNADSPVPSHWNQEVLHCRKCKRNLVCFLSHFFLQKMKNNLFSNQKFVTAGVDNQAMAVEPNSAPYPIPHLSSNAEEADTRIWLHALSFTSGNILILSPDTDVYHIGLPLVASTSLNVIVQLNKFNSRELRLLDMQALISAFASDPDLAATPTPLIPLTMQMLFVCTGCDFISFFHGIGKTSFLNTVFEYSSFISSSESGMLTDIDEHKSFLSFLRLVGSAYFRKHKSVFLPKYPTPMTLFNSLSEPSYSPLQHHSKWLEEIREKVWSKIKYEEDMVPSVGALSRHWRRSLYIIGLWKQAAFNTIAHPPVEDNGWKVSNEALEIDWDSNEHMTSVRNRVALIQRGCGCKTGCTTNRCKCRKGNTYCGPGCTCTNCSNHESSQDTASLLDIEERPEDSDTDDSDDSDTLDEQVDSIMQSVFGGDWGSDNESDTDMDYI